MEMESYYIYTNQSIGIIPSETTEYKTYTNNLLITSTGIYKLYKKHYYPILNSSIENETIEEFISETNNNYIIVNVLKDDKKINRKEQPLSYFPYESYYIYEKCEEIIINEHIIYVRKMINDIYERTYFEIVNVPKIDEVIVSQIEDFIKNPNKYVSYL